MARTPTEPATTGHYPRATEERLRGLLVRRLLLIQKLLRELVADGETWPRAIEIVRETMRRIPWDADGIRAVAGHVAGHTQRKLVDEVAAKIDLPTVKATVLAAPPAPSAPATVARLDAEDEVTINGTKFTPHRKERAVVLASIDRIELRFKGAPEGYQKPGQHDRKALAYGDLLDANVPATMLRMTDPDDWRQASKIAALRDRGYKVVPVEVPPEQASAIEAVYGAPAVSRAAVARGAGAEFVDRDAWVNGVVGRGRDIEGGLFGDIEETAAHGRARGWSEHKIGREISAQFGVATNRARFVARDRVGSLNAEEARVKQTGLGFTHYRWISADDSRVRPEHRELHGTVRAWTDPHPTEGHPGDAYGCRCVAIPITEDEANEGEAAERRAVAAGVVLGGAFLASAALAVAARAARMRPAMRKPAAFPLPAKPAAKPAEVIELFPQRAPTAPEAPPMPRNLNVLPFNPSEQSRRRVGLRSWFEYAHELVQAIREAERKAGEKLSDYGATFQAALKAIREGRTNREIRERLARLAGRGRRKPEQLPGMTSEPPGAQRKRK